MSLFHRIHLSFVLLLVVACAGSPASAQKTAGAQKLPEIKYVKYTLPNGLTVITHEDHRLPLVAVDLWYHVGPLNERPGRTGFAHLFEHMMFEGSEHVGEKAHTKDCAGGRRDRPSTAPRTLTGPTTLRRCPATN